MNVIGQTSRRDFLKKMAAMAAMTTAASLFPGIIFAEEQDKQEIPEGVSWKKGPCRFVV